MEPWQLAIFGVVSFATSVMSGISGGGAGFIMTPLAIFLGLTPAQSVATGKLAALSLTIGSLTGMRKIHGRVSWKRIVPIMILSFVIGLAAPFIIKSLDGEVYRDLLGVLLLLMIPVLIIKKVGLKSHTPARWQKYAGGLLLTFSLSLVAVFSGGLGTLVNIVLMGMMGMTALEANLAKRWAHLILITTVTVGLLTSGLIVWSIVPVAVITSFSGSYIGGHLAVKNGDKYVMKFMIGLMFVSAIALIIG